MGLAFPAQTCIMVYMMRDKDMYRFWIDYENGEYFELENLTKRQAVIRYNKAARDLGYGIKGYGWEVM